MFSQLMDEIPFEASTSDKSKRPFEVLALNFVKLRFYNKISWFQFDSESFHGFSKHTIYIVSYSEIPTGYVEMSFPVSFSKYGRVVDYWICICYSRQ